MRETRVWSLGREDSPGEGNGNPLQDSGLENPMDAGAWWSTVHGVTKSWTRLSDFTSLSQKLEVASGSLCNITSGENKDAPLYIQHNIEKHTLYVYTQKVSEKESEVAQSCLTLCNPMHCSPPGFLSFAISQNLLKLMSVESVMPSNHLILCIPFKYIFFKKEMPKI